jgi:hypothetical protein
MFSAKYKLQGRNGIKQLERVGPYLVITNRLFRVTGVSSQYTLINEAELQVHSIHSSQHDAVIFAQKQNQ